MKRTKGAATVVATLAAACVLSCLALTVGCDSSPTDTDDNGADHGIVGVWHREDDGALFDFAENDSIYLIGEAGRDTCIWARGTYVVDGDSIALDTSDGACTGTWEVTGEHDTLTLFLVEPCETIVLDRVSGPDHTEVPGCDRPGTKGAGE
jgi:hypothetical protein